FVAAGGFADDLRTRMGAQQLEQGRVARRIIGEGVGGSGQVQFQGSLGNVEAGVEDGRVVLTHTCLDTSRDGCRPKRSGNGSSLDQLAKAGHASGRSATGPAQGSRPRPRRSLCACRRKGGTSWRWCASTLSEGVRKLAASS